MCVSVRACVCAHVCVCMFMSVGICIYVCMHAYMHLCMCVCVCVCDITNYHHFLFYKECANCLAIACPAVNLEDCTDVFHHLMVNGSRGDYLNIYFAKLKLPLLVKLVWQKSLSERMVRAKTDAHAPRCRQHALEAVHALTKASTSKNSGEKAEINYELFTMWHQSQLDTE